MNELVLWKADQLSMLPDDVIDQLLLKVNERVKVRRFLRPSDETAYKEKLAYLQRVARSRGKPVC